MKTPTAYQTSLATAARFRKALMSITTILENIDHSDLTTAEKQIKKLAAEALDSK